MTLAPVFIIGLFIAMVFAVYLGSFNQSHHSPISYGDVYSPSRQTERHTDRYIRRDKLKCYSSVTAMQDREQVKHTQTTICIKAYELMLLFGCNAGDIRGAEFHDVRRRACVAPATFGCSQRATNGRQLVR